MADQPLQYHADAKENQQLVDKYNNSSRQDYVRDMAKDLDFHLGKQWTTSEDKELKKRGQYPLVIHRVHPIIRQKEAQLNARNPSFRCVPVGDSDVKVAKLFSELLTYVWNISSGRLVLRQILNDTLVKGLGYMFCYIDKYADFGRGEVKIDYLNPEDVFVDPTSRRPDFSDSANILVYKELTKDQIKLLVPEWSDEKIESLPCTEEGAYQYKTEYVDYDEPTLPVDVTTEEKKYKWIERYTKFKKVYYVVPSSEGLVTVSEEEYRARRELLDPVERAVFEQQSSKIYLDRVRVVTTCSTQKVSETVLPISHYPIIPFPNIYAGTPYPMGDVRLLKGLQREINKRRSLMIAHATVSTNPRLIVQEGSVENITQLELDWARPASVIKYFPDHEPPKSEIPAPLPSALYALEAEAKHDMEYTAGVFSVQQGDPKGAPDTFRGTMALEEFGSRRIQLTAQMVDEALAQAGRVLVELIQSNYTLEKTIRLVQPDGDQTAFTINQPVYDDYGEVVEKTNDITAGRYDVYYVAGSTLASNRWAMLEEMVKLYDRGIVDDIEVLKKTEVFDTPRLIERKSMLAKAMQQNQDFQKALKDSTQEIERLRKENLRLEKQEILEEFKRELQKKLDELDNQEDANRLMRQLEKKELQIEKQQTKKSKQSQNKE